MGFFGMTLAYIAFSILHFFQFVLALVVCGLYGVDLDRARKAGKYTDGKWVFAEVVGALSALTAILYSVPFILRFAAVPAWSFVIFVLWVALFGLFGNMYIKEDAEGNGDIQRMKNAVWVDLANMLLWFIGTVAGAAYWWMHKDRKSRFTGRAELGRGASTRSSGWKA
ncbi:Uracil phosphoribosyltransferase [Apiospora aurea]|uniref:Uracil phosphoribosyltransferase n=1 Tax=Apiospora aurea TaxID=335848 RepID=A0ABR1Q3B6_9PEZI